VATPGYDPPRAKALLDLYGYVNRDGDGWREQPDGRPLILEHASQADATARRGDELMQRDMTALGLRMTFRHAPFSENLSPRRLSAPTSRRCTLSARQSG
jgi:ABC-type transport system substrate-binding protein